MTDAERTALLWRGVWLSLGGVATSMALAGALSFALPQGILKLAISTVVLSAGLAATGRLFWRHSRKLAGDPRRTGMVAVLAFLVVHERQWLELLNLEGLRLYAARFLLTWLAFGCALLAYKWLQPLDEREASRNTQAR